LNCKFIIGFIFILSTTFNVSAMFLPSNAKTYSSKIPYSNFYKSSDVGTYIDDLIAQIDSSGTILYAHCDRQYNVRGLTDENGNIVELNSYTPYGERETVDSLGNPVASSTEIGFTGHRHDPETGLIYFWARYYSPEQGRFISRDPLGFVDGFSLYGGFFAEGFNLDPSGLAEKKAGTIIPSDSSGWEYINQKWTKKGDKFWDEDMTDKEKTDRKKYDQGCIGVTHCLLRKPLSMEAEDFKDCYISEKQALKAAELKKCPDGEKPKIFGLRYYDEDKKDRTTDKKTGLYEVDHYQIPTGKPGYTNFDFGYRQANGSYIHANEGASMKKEGMFIMISRSWSKFKSDYDGFNTTVNYRVIYILGFFACG